MSLDLHKIIKQIQNAADKLSDNAEEHARKIENAIKVIKNSNPEELEAKRANSDAAFLVPRTQGSVSNSYQIATNYDQYNVVAVDGSHIDLDRHLPMECYLINIGTVIINYGDEPSALLDSHPQLFTAENGLVIKDPDSSRHQNVEGPLLGILRTIQELRSLIDLVKGINNRHPVLALVDGSLILWGIIGQSYPEYIRKILLEDELIEILNELKELSMEKSLVLAAYISLPRSTEVTNLVRISSPSCPYTISNCDSICGSIPFGKRPCDDLIGVLDRDIFSGILGEGERSDIFASTLPLVESYYGENAVYFYYINTGNEIARIEIPKWVADEYELVDITHSLCLDQARLGHGYPISISEAHEQAVVTTGDREEFKILIENALGDKWLPVYTSLKNQSKKLKWL